MSGGLKNFDTSQRKTVPVNIECLEARLDVVENRTNRFGEPKETFQKQLVSRLKKRVLAEMLV